MKAITALSRGFKNQFPHVNTFHIDNRGTHWDPDDRCGKPATRPQRPEGSIRVWGGPNFDNWDGDCWSMWEDIPQEIRAQLVFCPSHGDMHNITGWTAYKQSGLDHWAGRRLTFEEADLLHKEVEEDRQRRRLAAIEAAKVRLRLMLKNLVVEEDENWVQIQCLVRKDHCVQRFDGDVRAAQIEALHWDSGCDSWVCSQVVDELA